MKETAAFRALASADRQFLLYELGRIDGKVTEEELARHVAARRHRISPEKVGEVKLERAHIRLVHEHLPLLRDLNVIEWDDGTVDLSTNKQRDQLLKTAEMLKEWPPDGPLQDPPS